MAATSPVQEATKPTSRRRVGSGFAEFMREHGVLTLAIGVVIGTAVNDLVKSLVDGIVTPLITLVSPETDLASFEFTVRSSTFKVGSVLDALLSFVIIALVVYGVAKYLLRNEKLVKKS